MSEMYSKAEDCYELSKKLKEKFGNRIDFYGFLYSPTPNGYYLTSYRKNNGEYNSVHNKNSLLFYLKYMKDVFLRIQIGSHSYGDNTFGEKLAALSDFYLILSEEYGEPTVFYTTKDDDEETLNLQWSFVNKEEDIKKFKSGNYFDDDEIDTLIVFGENREDVEKIGLSDKTISIIARQFGLPFELLHMADNDIEEYMKHKNNEEITNSMKLERKLNN